jgi:hypothetical protein
MGESERQACDGEERETGTAVIGKIKEIGE